MSTTSMILAAAAGGVVTAAPSTLFAYLGIRRVRFAYQHTCQQLEVAQYDATHDSLTGLANRRAFYEQAARMVASAGPRQRFAVALVDLDDFKAINDTHGHGVGDAALVAVASQLSDRVAGALVARLGGDEFAVIVPLTGAETVEQLGARLASGCTLAMPTNLPDDERLRDADVVSEAVLHLAWSVGVAPVCEPTDLVVVLGRADAALYAAKGGRAAAVYDPAPHDHSAAIPGQRPAARTRDLQAAGPSSLVAGGAR